MPLANVILGDVPITNATEEERLVVKQVLLTGFGALPVMDSITH